MIRRTRVLLALFAAVAVGGCASLRVASDYDRDVSFAGRETWDWVAPAAAEGTEEEAAEVERVNPFIDRRLERAVRDELAARGYRRVEEGPVDLLVAVSVLDPERAVDGRRGGGYPYALGFGFGFGFGPAYFYPGFGLYPGLGFGFPYYGSRYRRGFGYGRSYSSFRYGYYRPYFGYGYGGGGYGPYGYYGGSRANDLETLAPGTFVIDVLDGESGELIWRGLANGALAYAPDLEDLPDFIASVVHDIMEGFPPDTER
ncbi:MAG: DUF4136 domain-containing protein [Gemmatimonadetes bacterium]|nr:DUF4136 domain-containing protein [Gemmatimonadota bacterium]